MSNSPENNPDDADALIALAQKSFSKAAKAEVARNDSLGIPMRGTVEAGSKSATPPQGAKARTAPRQ